MTGQPGESLQLHWRRRERRGAFTIGVVVKVATGDRVDVRLRGGA